MRSCYATTGTSVADTVGGFATAPPWTSGRLSRAGGANPATEQASGGTHSGRALGVRRPTKLGTRNRRSAAVAEA